MKQCPTCRETYADETLSYCLKDGTSLVDPYDRNATLLIPPGRPTDQRTARFSDAETIRDRNLAPAGTRWPIYLLIALLAVLIGGGALVVAVFAVRGLSNQNASNPPGANNTNSRVVPPKSEPSVLFQDDFSGSEMNSDWQVVSGDWTVTDGVLDGVSNKTTSSRTPVWAAMTLNRELPPNCSVSFRTKIVEGDLSELMLHVSNGRYVRAYLYTIDQAAMLGDGKFLRENKPGSNDVDENLANLGGGPTVAQSGFPLLKDTWYNVKVTAKNTTYTISIGGQLVVKYEDAGGTLSKEGTIGLISNGHMQFADLKIVSVED